MTNGMKAALLAVTGTALLVVSSVSTSYDRSDMTFMERLIGVMLLLCAGALSIVKMDKTGEEKTASSNAPAKPPSAHE